MSNKTENIKEAQALNKQSESRQKPLNDSAKSRYYRSRSRLDYDIAEERMERLGFADKDILKRIENNKKFERELQAELKEQIDTENTKKE